MEVIPLDQIKKAEDFKEVYPEYYRLAALITPKHLETCSCVKTYVDSIIVKRKVDIIEELNNDGKDRSEEEFEGAVSNKINNIRHYIGEALAEQDRRCIYELKLIKQVLKQFEGEFDLKSPVFGVIITELISNILLSRRFDDDISKKGVSTFVESGKGGFDSPNKLLAVKRDFSKLIVDTSNKLYELKHGTKAKVEVDGKLSIKDFLDSVECKLYDKQ